jgi:hypothetical protein
VDRLEARRQFLDVGCQIDADHRHLIVHRAVSFGAQADRHHRDERFIWQQITFLQKAVQRDAAHRHHDGIDCAADALAEFLDVRQRQ